MQSLIDRSILQCLADVNRSLKPETENTRGERNATEQAAAERRRSVETCCHSGVRRLNVVTDDGVERRRFRTMALAAAGTAIHNNGGKPHERRACECCADRKMCSYFARIAGCAHGEHDQGLTGLRLDIAL